MSLHGRRPIKESISVDEDRDELIAYGVRISGELLRALGEPTPPGQWFRIVKVENGSATIQCKYDEERT